MVKKTPIADVSNDVTCMQHHHHPADRDRKSVPAAAATRLTPHPNQNQNPNTTASAATSPGQTNTAGEPSTHSLIWLLRALAILNVPFSIADFVIIPLRIGFALAETLPWFVVDVVLCCLGLVNAVVDLLITGIPQQEIRTDGQDEYRSRTPQEVLARIKQWQFWTYAILITAPLFLFFTSIQELQGNSSPDAWFQRTSNSTSQYGYGIQCLLIPRLLGNFSHVQKYFFLLFPGYEASASRLSRILRLLIIVLYMSHVLSCGLIFVYFISPIDGDAWLSMGGSSSSSATTGQSGDNVTSLAFVTNPRFQRKPRLTSALKLLDVSNSTAAITSSTAAFRLSFEETSFPATYQFAFYVTTVLIVGYQDVWPQTTAQFVWSLVTVGMGSVVFATIVGVVSELLENLDPMSNFFRQKIDKLHAFFMFRKISSQISMRILTYYRYLWSMNSTDYSEETILGDMPVALRRDIESYLFGSLVSKVPFFKTADPIFIERVVSTLKRVFFLPESFVVIKGTVGREMYFLYKGTVDVVNEDGTVIFATLNEGSFFGELSIVFEQKRSASIRAKTMCEVYVLSKADFEATLAEFPERREEIAKVGQERLKELKAKAAKSLPPIQPMMAKKRDGKES
eukprot:ANDGO_05438.mRNA.1 Cyclic nucleotide-gated cation channel